MSNATEYKVHPGHNETLETIKAGPVVGIARSLTGLSSLLTLAFTPTAYLFAPSEGRPDPLNCESAFGNMSIFCLSESRGQELGVTLSMAILSLVVFGILPGLTSIFHFYVALCLNYSLAIPDGGDQIAVFLSFMFAIIYFGDLRISHWSRPTKCLTIQSYSSLIGIFMIKGQMAVVYLNASIHKLATEDWREGSALFYLLGGSFEPHGVFKVLFTAIVNVPILTVISTWSVMLIEIFLGVSFALPKNLQQVALFVGLLFHIFIFLFLGIASFQIVMVAGLIILCSPTTLPAVGANLSIADLRRRIMSNDSPARKLN